MKARGLILLGVSALLAFVAVAWMRKPAATTSGMAQIVVAKTAFNFGDRLVPEKLRVVEYPPASVPPGAFSSVEELTGSGDERVALRAIDPNEPVLASKISGNGGRAILSTVIDKGMRAVTISVNDVKGVAGFVQPGDRVDVLLTRSANNAPTGAGNSQQRNDILLQNVKVLGVDQQADDKKDKPVVAKAVTLEVTPEDGQKLTLAASIGSLSLALRNFANPDPVQTRSLSVSDLVPIPQKDAPPAAELAPPPRPRIEILRGTAATTYDVNKDGGVAIESRGPRAAKPPKPAKRLASAPGNA